MVGYSRSMKLNPEAKEFRSQYANHGPNQKSFEQPPYQCNDINENLRYYENIRRILDAEVSRRFGIDSELHHRFHEVHHHNETEAYRHPEAPQHLLSEAHRHEIESHIFSGHASRAEETGHRSRHELNSHWPRHLMNSHPVDWWKHVMCFQCGKKGHMAVGCPQKGQDPACFSCGLPGHFWKNCPRKKQRKIETNRPRTRWQGSYPNGPDYLQSLGEFKTSDKRKLRLSEDSLSDHSARLLMKDILGTSFIHRSDRLQEWDGKGRAWKQGSGNGAAGLRHLSKF